MMGCQSREGHFITDEVYRSDLYPIYKRGNHLWSKGDLFSVFNQPMNMEEKGGNRLSLCLYALRRYYRELWRRLFLGKCPDFFVGTQRDALGEEYQKYGIPAFCIANPC